MKADRITADHRTAGSVPDLVAGFDSGPADDQDVFTIRDLTREFDVSARTLRFYEEKGLLDPTRKGEQRLYSRRDRARLKYVLMGKSVGFSLEEVREMLDLYDLGDGGVRQLQVALAKFQERIERLERQKADIESAIGELTRASINVATMLGMRDQFLPNEVPEPTNAGSSPPTARGDAA